MHKLRRELAKYIRLIHILVIIQRLSNQNIIELPGLIYCGPILNITRALRILEDT